MSASLPDLLGNSSSNLSSPEKPAKAEQLLEGDKTLRSRTGTESKATVTAGILSQKEQKRKKNTDSICCRLMWQSDSALKKPE